MSQVWWMSNTKAECWNMREIHLMKKKQNELISVKYFIFNSCFENWLVMISSHCWFFSKWSRYSTFSGKCDPGPGPELLIVFVIRWPIENCGDLCVTASYWPSYAPGPGKRTLTGSMVFCRPTNVYAGADRICASLLDPKTVGIEYSFGALHLSIFWKVHKMCLWLVC